MEKNRRNKLGTIIILLVILVIVFSIFIVYDKLLSKNRDENQQDATLDYRIEGTTSNKTVLVNDKQVNVTGTDIEVIGTLKDVLVVKVWSFDFYEYYIVDKNASIVSVFAGSNAKLDDDNRIYLKGDFTGECTIEEDSILIKSDLVASEPTFISCSKEDNDIVEYTEKFPYLGNGKFSSSTLVQTTTAKQYRQNNNISCD